MFSRSANKLPKRIEFSIKPEDIQEDYEAIASKPEDKKMLYECIDSKQPPPDSRLNKINIFLSDNETFGRIIKDLRSKSDHLCQRRNEMEQEKERLTNLLD